MFSDIKCTAFRWKMVCYSDNCSVRVRLLSKSALLRCVLIGITKLRVSSGFYDFSNSRLLFTLSASHFYNFAPEFIIRHRLAPEDIFNSRYSNTFLGS